MKRALVGVAVSAALFGACAGRDDPNESIRSELAPSGTLRAGINFGNPILAVKDAGGGEPQGVAVDVVRELGRRLDVPVSFVTYDSAAAMADAAPTGAWDVAFLGADPARAETITFTPPYLQLEATYLVVLQQPRLQTIADVDQPGVRIAARPRSAYDLALRRALKQATLVYPEGDETDLEMLTAGKADALAGLRHVLEETAATLEGARVLDGHAVAIQQAIGVPKGREAAAAYLQQFVEDVKKSGFLTEALQRRGARGAAVAP